MRELIGTKGVTVPSDAVAEIASEEELRWLVRELDPGNDSIPMPPEKALQGLSLTGTDFSLSSDEGIRWVDNNRDARWKLRPLVSAANRFGLEIPWHAASISEERYRERFLHALAAHGDANRIFSLLEQHQELILPSLDGLLASKLSALMDERILPFVSRFLNAGPPRVLEALCTLVARIFDDRIVPILARLLERWVVTTRRLEPKPSDDDAVPLARALEALAGHPRFEEVPTWDDQLLDLLGPKMEFFRRKDLVRIVRRSPKAYTLVEALLQNASSFEHWWEDEIDVLDGAADELFARVGEGF